MSNPAASSNFWSDIASLNAKVDQLIDRVFKASEPSMPIGREIPFFVSIENRFNNLPPTWVSPVSAVSDVVAGNNVKSATFTNGSGRVCIREIGLQALYVFENDSKSRAFTGMIQEYGVNFRWNFKTSITNRQYADRRVLAKAAGRWQAGNRMAFKQPLIIEPMESLVFECELLSAGMTEAALPPTVVVSMLMSGYREAV